MPPTLAAAPARAPTRAPARALVFLCAALVVWASPESPASASLAAATAAAAAVPAAAAAAPAAAAAAPTPAASAPAPAAAAPVAPPAAAPAAAPAVRGLNGSALATASRRILNGKNAPDTPFMVYLQMSLKNSKLAAYKGWVCGGIIVSELYVLSSAACVEDAEHFYVVAGSKKHVDGALAATDPCSKNRRKVIWKCVPKDYDFLASDSKRWMTNDLAIIKVEHAFNFDRVEPGCDYAPQPICYNTNDSSLEAAGVKGAIYGWGSLSKFRESFLKNKTRARAGDDDQSVEDLQLASINIMSKEECLKKWPEKYHDMINKFMICTNDTKANSDDDDCKDKYAKCADINFSDDVRMRNWPMDTGQHGLRRMLLLQHHQQQQQQRRFIAAGESEQPAQSAQPDADGSSSPAGSGFEMPVLRGKKRVKGRNYNSSTKMGVFNAVYQSTVLPDAWDNKVPITGGICENDHGGPLVVENAGGNLVAVGIISACKVDPASKECRGPFLFTSIMVNKELIECIVLGKYKKTCRKMLRAGVNNRNWNVRWRPEDA